MAVGSGAARVGGPGAFVLRSLEQAAEDRSGVRATVVVVLVAVLVAIVLWFPLAYPVRALTGIVPVGNCAGLSGPLASLCSVKLAVLTLLAPAVMLVAVFLLRRPIAAVVRRSVERLPDVARFLVGPALATALFTLTWSNAHQDPLQSGLVPQILFPALVGLFGWATVRWNAAIQDRSARFFAIRDALARPRRFAIAAAVPAVLGIVIGLDPSGFAAKEQLVVLVGLASTYVALVPRTGDLIAAIEEVVRR